MDRYQALPLVELRRQAERYNCEVVTEQFLQGVRKDFARMVDAERQLRDLAALRLVAERVDWRGKLARRWIKRSERFLDLLRSPE